MGLLARAQVVEWRHHFLANAYPVYALGYRERLAEVERGVSSLANLDLLGRGGRFWYSHLHDQLRAARDYVRSLPASAGAGSEPTPSIAAHIRRSEAKLQ